VLLSQGYGQWRKAGVGILIVLVASFAIFEPLQKALYKLTVKSKVLSLLVEMPKEYPHIFSSQGRIDGVHVNYRGDTLHVDIEGTFPKIDISPEEAQEKINLALDIFQVYLQRELGTAAIVELSVVPIDILNFYSDDDYVESKIPDKTIIKNNNNENIGNAPQ
jgi:hypothetical protein